MKIKFYTLLVFVVFYGVFIQFEAYLYGLFASLALAGVAFMILKIMDWDQQRTKKKLHKLVEKI